MRVRSVMILRSDSVRTSWSVIGPLLPDPATCSTSAENRRLQKATGSSIVADDATSCTPGLSRAMRRIIQATLAPKNPVYWCASSTTMKRSERIMSQNCADAGDLSERARWYETKSKLVASMSGGSASRAARYPGSLLLPSSCFAETPHDSAIPPMLAIWSAASAFVGYRKRAETAFFRRLPRRSISSMTGMRNAMVLPDAVDAVTTTLAPARIFEMASAWNS